MFGWLRDIRAELKDLRYSVAHHKHEDSYGFDRILMVEERLRSLRDENFRLANEIVLLRQANCDCMLENACSIGVLEATIVNNNNALLERITDIEFELL